MWISWSKSARQLVVPLLLVVFFVSSRPSHAQPPAASSPDAVAAYTKAANLQNNEAFDLAAEAWSDFLHNFPDDARAVDARYYLGVCQIQLNQLAQARESLRAVVNANVPFDRLEDAYLNLGWILYTLGQKDRPDDLQESAKVFSAMLDRFPQGRQRDQALFLLGEGQYLRGQLEQAARTYQQLIDQHAQSTFRPDAFYALGVAYEELDRFPDANQVYDRFLSEFADHELTTEVKMRKAECVLRVGNFADAEFRFGEVAAVPGFESADRARYRQAYCVAQQDRFQEAGALFASLVKDFPKSAYVADASMAAARAFYRADQSGLAAQWFDRVLQRNGEHRVEAAHWRAQLFLQQGQPREALTLVERILPHSAADPFLPNLKLDRADALYEIEDRRAESLPLYLEIAGEHADHEVAPRAAYNAAYAAMELAEYARGLQFAEAWMQSYPGHPLTIDVKNVIAECLLQSGRHAEAAKRFAELTQVDREEASKWKLREALALYAQGEYKESLQRLTPELRSLDDPAEQAEAHYLCGMNHLGMKQFDAAEAAFHEALRSDPDWNRLDEVLLNLSKAQRGAGNVDKARDTIARLRREFPSSSVQQRAHFRSAEYAYAAEDYPAAIQQYSEFIESHPNSELIPVALYGLGWSHLRSRSFAEAIEHFTQLIQKFSDHSLVPQAHYARAMTRQQAGDYDAAIHDVQRFLEHKPDRQERSDALYVLGLCYAGKNDLSRAISTFQSILDDHATYNGTDKVLYELAWAHKALNNSDQTEQLFRRLTKIPESELAAEAFYHVGEAAYQRSEYQEAAEAYRAALERVGDNRELGEKAGYKLGWAYYQLDEFTLASKAFVRQIEIQPEGPLAGDAHFMLGECAFRQNDFPESLGHYAKAAQQNLSSDVIVALTYLHAGQAAGQLKQWEKSLSWLEQIAAKQPQTPYMPQIQFEMAVAQQNLGNEKLALKLFGSVADRSQDELAARARFMMGELHYADKEYAQAIREFRVVMFAFDHKSVPEVGRWQAKAGFEAGQCAGVLASQQQDSKTRDRFIDLAKKFFEYVRSTHPESDEAQAAVQQLKKYGA